MPLTISYILLFTSVCIAFDRPQLQQGQRQDRANAARNSEINGVYDSSVDGIHVTAGIRSHQPAIEYTCWLGLLVRTIQSLW
jgi:hypothetical protein